MNDVETPRDGFTLKELFVVIFIIAALLFCLIPFGRRCAREAARRMQCNNHLKQLGLALHNYHDTFGRFPMSTGGTGLGGNESRRSGLVALLPFIEESSLYDQIMDPAGFEGFSPGGPAPWETLYTPWQTRIDTYICPSVPSTETDFQPTNYTFCIGDVSQNLHDLPKLRGAFAPGKFSQFKDMTDGASNTIAMAEMGTKWNRQLMGQYAIELPPNVLSDPAIAFRTTDSAREHYLSKVELHPLGRGYNWADGGAGPQLVNTILPPNSPSCAVGGEEAVDGIYSAGSYHPGGCHVLLCDGSVRFISEEIDAGNPSASPPSPDALAAAPSENEDEPTATAVPSPFGVWGALGTSNGREVIPADAL